MAILLRALEPVSEAYLPLKVPVGKGALERNKIFELGDAAGSDNRHARCFGDSERRRNVQPLHHSVAVDVGVDDA